jgi:hypothetical protein
VIIRICDLWFYRFCASDLRVWSVEAAVPAIGTCLSARPTQPTPSDNDLEVFARPDVGCGMRAGLVADSSRETELGQLHGHVKRTLVLPNT